MSHFSVLVVADDLEKALQPFHEFECTGDDDEYVQEVDVTEEAKEKGLDWFGFEDRTVTDESQVDREGDHRYGYAVVDSEGTVLKAIRRTNPNKKWDWWTVGGRFSNKLLFKDGTRGDSGAAGDVDWDGMIAHKSKLAAEEFDKVTAVIAGRTVVTWAQALAKYKAGELTIDAARDLYKNQEVVKDLLAADAIDSWGGAETLSQVVEAADRGKYIGQQGELNASTWALLHDGKWTERGEMGWFGMSSADDSSTKAATSQFWDPCGRLNPSSALQSSTATSDSPTTPKGTP